MTTGAYKVGFSFPDGISVLCNAPREGASVSSPEYLSLYEGREAWIYAALNAVSDGICNLYRYDGERLIKVS